MAWMFQGLRGRVSPKFAILDGTFVSKHTKTAKTGQIFLLWVGYLGTGIPVVISTLGKGIVVAFKPSYRAVLPSVARRTNLAYAKILQIPGVVSNPCTPHIVLFSLYSSV
jgi:hypothetical protein